MHVCRPSCLVLDVQVKNLPAGVKPEEFHFFHGGNTSIHGRAA
jgi:hypothetical protein